MDPVTMGLIGSGAGMLGDLLGLYGAGQRAEDQAALMRAGMDQAQGALMAGYNAAEGYQQPYMQAGGQALGQMGAMLAGFDPSQFVAPDAGQFAHDMPTYTVDQFMDPAMDARIAAGTRAVEGSAASRGALRSGATLKGITDYAQQLASQEYGNAFQRMMAMGQQARQDRGFAYQQFSDNATRAAQNAAQRLQAFQVRLGGLGNMAGMGQSAAGNMGNIAMGRGEGLANLAMGRAQNEANAVGPGFADYLGAAFGGGGAMLGGYAANEQANSNTAQQNAMLRQLLGMGA